MSLNCNWAAILAGGDGQRLRSFTRMLTGDERPKQFCRLFGRQTLLGETRRRLSLNVEASRTLYVVNRSHAVFYEPELGEVAAWQRVEQPSNRGTTAAVAYTLARLRALGADGVVGLFPADHYYRDQRVFERTVADAYALAALNPHSVVLLGAEATHAETEYGWIEPGYTIDAPRFGSSSRLKVRSVKQFCEKPSSDVAEQLLRRHCLWNTLVVVGRVWAFEQLLEHSVPEIWEPFTRLREVAAGDEEEALVQQLYASLAASDFSRDVLATQPERLTVVNLPDAGWTDLGQPDRLLDVLAVRNSASETLRRAAG
jgi:mannose-1-phosphate guanylyltransferase